MYQILSSRFHFRNANPLIHFSVLPDTFFMWKNSKEVIRPLFYYANKTGDKLCIFNYSVSLKYMHIYLLQWTIWNPDDEIRRYNNLDAISGGIPKLCSIQYWFCMAKTGATSIIHPSVTRTSIVHSFFVVTNMSSQKVQAWNMYKISEMQTSLTQCRCKKCVLLG